MIRRRNIFIASVVALVVAVAVQSAGAANKVSYTISGNQAQALTAATAAAAGVTFTVTRSAPTDNDPVVWVANVCKDGKGGTVSAVAYPVLWGLASSLSGTTQPFDVTGAATCTAWVTVKPYQLDHPSVLNGAVLTY
jgi:hypothetical protein